MPTLTLHLTFLPPDGVDVPCRMKKTGTSLYECVYVPQQPGNYVINVTYGGQHVTKSPFKVQVGPFKESKIRAYGPGLIGGVVGFPAIFTVETNGETGALGEFFFLFFSIFYYPENIQLNLRSLFIGFQCYILLLRH